MTQIKPACVACLKEKAVARCEGCSKSFCYIDFGQHRQELSKIFDEIEINRDVIVETLNKQTTDSQEHAFLDKINQWEQRSIEQIKTVAQESREVLQKHLHIHLTKVREKLEELTTELRRCRQRQDFVDTDLDEWKDKLNQIKQEINNPINIMVEEQPVVLVSKIRVCVTEDTDIFASTTGNTIFEQNGKIVIKDASSGYTEVRGEKEYSNGQHIVKFKVEQLSSGGWMMFGIVSKSTQSKAQSYNLPSSYGWQNQGCSFSAGAAKHGQGSEAIQNDNITLTIDCNGRSISFLNERTNRQDTIPVDINICPFPWKLHFNLHQASTRVRIV